MLHILQAIILYSFYCIISLTILLILYYKHAFQYWKKQKIPYPNPSFPFGNMDMNFTKRISQSLADVYVNMKKQGHAYCGYYMFAMPVFMPIDPNLSKHILVSHFNNFNSRGFHLNEVNDPMGVSILTTSGEKWKNMRTKLGPTWTATKTKMMLPIVMKYTQELIQVIDEYVKKGEPVEILDICKRYAVDVICSSAFGVEGGCLKNNKSEFFIHAKSVFEINMFGNIRLTIAETLPNVNKFLKIKFFSPTVTNFFRDVVFDTVAHREQNNIERPDFLNMLIRLKNNKSIEDNEETSDKISSDGGITLNEVASQCFLFFLAGFETTSNTIHFMLYELAKNPDIQQKTRENILETLKRNKSELNYDSLQAMRYLDNVFNETMRKYPTVHMLNRVCSEDFTIPDSNITIKKGTHCALSILALHSDPEYYPNPEVFDPERFTDEAKAARPPYTYLPFGDGPRICPGLRFGSMEVKICVASLLLKYKFMPHPLYDKITLICSGNILQLEKPILLNIERL